MVVDFFDVAHGFCAAVFTDNRKLLLVDCGKNDETGFAPSSHLHAHGWRTISGLIVQNFDQDHVSDLDNILRLFNVEIFYRNTTVPPEYLRGLKLLGGGITRQMGSAISLHQTYTEPILVPQDYGGASIRLYFNGYPHFTDTNNLSAITFMDYDGMRIAFTGDIEVDGWNALLRNPIFVLELSGANIFVASHHGRESGFCKEVFDHCYPDIIIMSDKEIVHDTQEHDYSTLARGIIWNGGPQKRYVLSTRKDGRIRLTKTMGGPYHVTI